MYSQQLQNLMHWLIADYTNLRFNESYNGSPSVLNLKLAKRELKFWYSQTSLEINKDLSEKELMKCMIGFQQKILTVENKVELANLFVDWVVEYERALFNFSVGQKSMNQEQALAFVKWLFDFMHYFEIPLRKEIIELLKKQDDNFYIWTLLYYRKCFVCGDVAEFHHIKGVFNCGGRKKDKGEIPMLPLCTTCHTKIHSDSRFRLLYNDKGMLLNEKQRHVLKSKYEWLFEGLEPIDNYGDDE
ncbi:MAG: hypothetical protein ACRC0V_05085 [Fusobacteriaceae bacterium]